MGEPRVLFIHGLEGSPQGTKVRLLRAQGFEVEAPDMEMSVMDFRKRNAAIRNVLRLGETRTVVTALLGAAASPLRRGRVMRAAAVAVGATAVGAGWWWLRRDALVAEGLSRSFAACVEIQKAAIARWEPDVVVGSSWGGAVAAHLVATGAWEGPTVLLAPAVHAIARMRRTSADADVAGVRRAATLHPIVVFHDPTDDTVPHTDSIELTTRSSVELRSVDGGGHRLNELVERGELAQAIRDLFV